MFSSFRKSWLNKLSRSLFGRSGPKQPVERRRSRPMLEVLEDRVVPNAYVVNTTDGGVATGTGLLGNLQYCVAQANSNPNSTITFSSGTNGTAITLTAVVSITANTTITGNGAANTLISGNNAVQVFKINSGDTVSISSLTAENGLGSVSGGINPNANELGNGGVWNNGGTLTLSNDTISGNSCPTGNQVGDNGGAALWNVGSSSTATLTNDTITGNTGATGGGIANFNGTVSLTNCTLTGNHGKGGAISNAGTMTITGCSMSSNGTGVDGGAIYNLAAGTDSGGTAYVVGTLTVATSAIFSNSTSTSTLASGGGIYNAGTVTVSNSTIYGNVSRYGGGIGSISGSTLTLQNDTISGNSANAPSGTWRAGGIAWNGSGTLFTLSNSIVAGNIVTSGGALDPDIGPGRLNNGTAAVTANYDLIGSVSDGSAGYTILSGGNNQTGVSAGLVTPAALNGGTTNNFALTSTSPAVGMGEAIAGFTTDQRGISLASPPDIGAFQLETVIPSTANLPQNAATMTIGGSAFDPTAANDSVSFSNAGVSGSVTAATSTSLTITVTGLSGVTAGNAILASVTVDGVSSGSAVQVATITAAGPSVNMSTASLPTNAATITITGSAFGTSADAVTVSFTPSGVLGTVTSANNSSITVSLTGLAGVSPGTPLDAVVTVSGSGSGAPVQVATVTAVLPTITMNTASLPVTSTSMTIAGTDFDVIIANDSVSFSPSGVTGTVTAATPTSLTVSLSGLSSLTGGTILSAVATVDTSSGSLVEVAVAAPTVTATTTSVPDNASTISILGHGYDLSPFNNTVAFGSGAAGTVTAVNSAGTQLTVTLSAGPNTTGSLTAVVTTDGTSSGAPVEVANITNGTWVVTDSNGASGSGSATDVTLPYAVAHYQSGDSITFASGLSGSTISLTSVLALNHSVTITGLGAANLAVSGNGVTSVFSVLGGATVSISGLTVENGSAVDNVNLGIAGGIVNAGNLTMSYDIITGNNNTATPGADPSSVLGAVNNTGTMWLSNCTVSNNVSWSGGGVANLGTLTVTDTTFSGNRARHGGAILNEGTLTISDSTISGNTAQFSGAGIQNSGGTLILTDSTIAFNQSAGTAPGAGLYNVSGSVSMTNTIVAGNISTGGAPDIDGTITANYSMIGNTAGATMSSGANNVLDPSFLGLAPLNRYGGLTQTVALVSGSPALGVGSPAGTDQRGFPIDTVGTGDIGAYQDQGVNDLVVNTLDDTATGAEPAGELSLRDAINLANVLAPAGGPSMITFDPSLSGGTITLAGVPLPTIAANITIDGLGTANLTVSGGDPVQIFNVNAGATASISGLTIDNGAPSSGGGIYNSGTLTLSNDAISANIYNAGGALILAGDGSAFISATNITNNGAIDLAGNSNSIGALTGNGTVTSNLVSYQIDNGQPEEGFNDTLYSEFEDNWVGNVFTAPAAGIQLQSVAFYDGSSALTAGTLPNPYVTAAIYLGAPGAGLTLVPGSENTVPLNATAGSWINVPFAEPQNVPGGVQYTVALLIDDVPNTIFPFMEDTSGSNANSYFDDDAGAPGGTVNTYDLASPNDPTPNGDVWGSSGSTNAAVGVTLMRVNYASTATLTVTRGGSFSGSIQDGSSTVALTVGGASQTLYLYGNNTYSGLTTINNTDTLQTGSSTALTSATNVNDNGILDLGSSSIGIGALNGSGAVIDSGASAWLTVYDGGSFTGNITGSNTGLIVAGGTLILSGNDTYSQTTDISNVGATLQAASNTAFSPNSDVNVDGVLDLGGYNNSIGGLYSDGTVTSNGSYQIDNNQALEGFNDSLYSESEDNWVGNVFTGAAVGTTVQSISFYDSTSSLNSGDLSDPNITAALYTGAPGAGLTLVPGSVNTVALNANPGSWVTVPLAAAENIAAAEVFTVALLINNVPNTVFPWTEDTSGSNTNSYFDVDAGAPSGTVETYDLASPNDPTPNGDVWGSSGSTNAAVGTTLLRANYVGATLTVTAGGSFNGSIQDGVNPVALTVAGSSQTLALAGNNPFSGATTVNNTDTLVVNGTNANSSVTVNGTLGGTGTVADVTADTGVVSPGSPVSSTGTLTAASADLNLNINIMDGSNDELVTTGTATLDGTSTLTLDLTGLTTTTGPVTVVSAAGGVTGQFSSIDIVNNTTGYPAVVTYTGNSVIVSVPTPSNVWVNDNWVNVTNPSGPLVDGDIVAAPVGETAPNLGGATLVFGDNAFATIQDGLNASASGGTVYVLAGNYSENDVISQSVNLLGAQAGQGATTRNNSFNAATESILTTSSTSDLIEVEADNVTIDGLTLDGASTANYGISNADGPNFHADNDLTVQNVILRNFGSGWAVYLDNISDGQPNHVTNGLNFNNNVIRSSGYGMVLLDNVFGTITQNDIATGSNFSTGIYQGNYFVPGTVTISDNTFTVPYGGNGVVLNNDFSAAVVKDVDGNTINAAAGVVAGGATWGIALWTQQNGPTVSLNDNVIGNSGGVLDDGIWISAEPPYIGSPVATISGGSITGDVGIDVEATTVYGAFATSVDVNGVTITASDTGILENEIATGSIVPSGNLTVNLTDSTISSATTGVLLNGYSPTAEAVATLTDSTISGNTTGVHVEAYGSLGNVQGNAIIGNSGDGIEIDANSGAIGSIAQNDLSGNGASLVLPGALVVDAPEDYWGAAFVTPATVAAGPLNGTSVNFEPVATGGTDNSPGFSPNMATLAVDINSTSPSTLNVGQNYTLNLAPANSASNNTTLTQWDINWGDGTTTLTAPGITNSVTHTYTTGSTPTYTITAVATDELGNTATATIGPITVLSSPPPTITSVVINQDISALYNAAGQPSPGTQRSMVDDIVYTFSEPVYIDPTFTNVFTVALVTPGTVPTVSWAPVAGTAIAPNKSTEWAVSFSGAGTSGGSIANGTYDITIDPTKVAAVTDGQQLSVSGGLAPAPNNPGYATQAFFRLFGDINGDEVVNNADNVRFKQALSTYNAAFDFNADNTVNNADNVRFKLSLSIAFTGFSPTI